MKRFLTLCTLGAAIICAAVLGTNAYPSSSTAASVGQATFQASVPGGSVPLNSTVDVPFNLTSFTPGISPTWGGYDLEVSYNAAVVTPTVDVVGASSHELGQGSTNLCD